MVDKRKLDMSKVPPRPTAAKPGDLGSGENLPSGGNLDDAERNWLIDSRRAARRRTALLVGLAVVGAVIVSLLAYRWKRR